jgi:radical SAM enzyme (TIGR01210 family)
MGIDQLDLAHFMIRKATSTIRSETLPIQYPNNKAITTQIRTGDLDGKLVYRLLIHLHSTGCGWARRSGGCTMCGFFAATSTGEPISSKEYLKQVLDALIQYDSYSFSVLGILNAGNLLNENEMPFDALEMICKEISQRPFVRKISIESKLEYIDIDKLKKISSLLPGVEIELGIGVESYNEKIRDLCINKPFSNLVLENKTEALLQAGITPKAYLLLKPPFLTEKEALDDFINSYLQLNSIGIERIDCETMTIEDHTLVHQLWKNNHYRLPWLWTMIYLLDNLQNSPLYFTPFQYIVNALAIAHNCEKCSEKVKKAIFDYQDNQIDLKSLLEQNCDCREKWLAELNEKDYRPIETRIIETLSELELFKETSCTYANEY